MSNWCGSGYLQFVQFIAASKAGQMKCNACRSRATYLMLCGLKKVVTTESWLTKAGVSSACTFAAWEDQPACHVSQL